LHIPVEDLATQDVRRASDSIYRNAKVQSEIIDDVLDVSRIISGKVRIQPQPLDLAVLLQNAMESVRAAADAKGLALVALVGMVPLRVSGDATRIQQVFRNLLSNAVRFTPSGGRVRVSLEIVGAYVEVQVSDNGIGIGADFLPHVFERFRQRDSSSTRAHGGLGLGLAIVRHLVELHGGTVSVASEGEGKGATFTVTLPAQPFEERRHEERAVVRRAPPVVPVPDDVPSLCGIRVLVVDDERDARELAASVLRQHGTTVAVAGSAAEALQQCDLFDPSVLLLDLAMPEMDGYGLVERIRKSTDPKRDIPAIAFTAYARDEDRQRALANGFQLHLAKPVDSHALVRAVASVWQDRGSTES
jgi:CheY-like chemotaxis protein/two-component sensor histidine kinase